MSIKLTFKVPTSGGGTPDTSTPAGTNDTTPSIGSRTEETSTIYAQQQGDTSRHIVVANAASSRQQHEGVCSFYGMDNSTFACFHSV